MVSISPVLQKDITEAAKEFLSDEPGNSRFGHISLAVSAGGPVTPPTDITRRQADTLLHGLSIDGSTVVPTNPDDIAAWRLSFNASPGLNLLYAVAPESISSNIKTAQERASSEMLGELAACILGAKAQRGSMGYRMDDWCATAPTSTPDAGVTNTAHSATVETILCRYVIFRSEVSEDQHPHLNTTAFLINRIRLERGDVRVLASTEEMGRIRLPLYESYAGALDYFTEKAIGPFHSIPHVREMRIAGMPQEVVRKFFSGPGFYDQGPTLGNHVALCREELFAKWQARATQLGWGPKEAETYLRQIRREQFWSDVKSRCTREVAHARKTLQGAAATFGGLFTRDGNRQKKTEERSQGKKHGHTHSQSH